jgi:hypothetical protein
MFVELLTEPRRQTPVLQASPVCDPAHPRGPYPLQVVVLAVLGQSLLLGFNNLAGLTGWQLEALEADVEFLLSLSLRVDEVFVYPEVLLHIVAIFILVPGFTLELFEYLQHPVDLGLLVHHQVVIVPVLLLSHENQGLLLQQLLLRIFNT